MICSCSRLGTGCSVPTRVTFAPGHNGRARGQLVAALAAKQLILFDGVPVDPWEAASTLGLTAVVELFLAKTLAANEVRAQRALDAAAAETQRDRDRSYAHTMRDRRIADREAARALAEAARQRLIDRAVAERDAAFPAESWRDLPLA